MKEENVDIAQDAPEPPQAEPEAEEEDDGSYKVRILKFGETDEENYEKFGIRTNYFTGNLTEEIFETNNHPTFLYTVHSSYLTRKHEGSMPMMMHNSIIVPVLQELKGFANYYIYDCDHPTL